MSREKPSLSTPENRHKTGKVRSDLATRFRSGQSGNPGGRPKSAPLSHACRDLLAAPVPNDRQGRTYAEVIALAQKAMPATFALGKKLRIAPKAVPANPSKFKRQRCAMLSKK